MRKTAIYLLSMIVSLFLTLSSQVAAAQSASTDEPAGGTEVGDMAPNFSLPDGLTGESVELAGDILGKDEGITALVFMNTTCSACQAEVTLLSKLADRMDGKLKICLLAVDIRGKKLVKSFAEHYRYNVRYLLDPEYSVPPLYGFTYTPALVLLSGEGEILYKKGGYLPGDADALIAKIQELTSD